MSWKQYKHLRLVTESRRGGVSREILAHCLQSACPVQEDDPFSALLQAIDEADQDVVRYSRSLPLAAAE